MQVASRSSIPGAASDVERADDATAPCDRSTHDHLHERSLSVRRSVGRCKAVHRSTSRSVPSHARSLGRYARERSSVRSAASSLHTGPILSNDPLIGERNEDGLAGGRAAADPRCGANPLAFGVSTATYEEGDAGVHRLAALSESSPDHPAEPSGVSPVRLNAGVTRHPHSPNQRKAPWPASPARGLELGIRGSTEPNHASTAEDASTADDVELC